MVDTLQRLGIDYYFQEEIEAFLKRQYMIFSAPGNHQHDVYEVALRFRLLRQEGYQVSQGEQVTHKVALELLIFFLLIFFTD